MDEGMKRGSADPEQSSHAGNPSTASLKGSIDPSMDLSRKQSSATKEASACQPAQVPGEPEKPITLGQQPGPREQSECVMGGESYLADKSPMNALTTQKDSTGFVKDTVDDEQDPREPLPGRAIIDRRVSMGEVVHTIAPVQCPGDTASGVSDGGLQYHDIMAAMDEARFGIESGSLEPHVDPREPMSRRASLDRLVSLGRIAATKIATRFSMRSASACGESDANMPAKPKDASGASMEISDEPDLDPREPMRGRASVDMNISLGNIVPTMPPARSVVRTVSGSRRAGLGRKKKDHLLENRRAPRLMVLTGLIGLFMALTLLCLLIVRRVYSTAQSANRSVCDTEDCIAHARSILANLNESANPCVDFHAHVCGGSVDDAGRRDAHSARGSPLARAYGDVMHTLGNAETFRAANHSSVAATKAFAAVTNCMESSRHSAADSFAAFMRDRGIIWPLPATASGKNATAANVLDVLLDLAVNWRVCLWFSVVVSHTATLDGVPAVVFGEPGDIPALRMEQLSVYDDEAYADVVRSLSRYLTDGKVAPDDVAVKELHVDNAAFQGVLLNGADDDDDIDIVLPLGNITKVFGDVLSKAAWSDLLDKHLNNVIGDVSKDTRLHFLNQKRFGRLGRLVGSLPASRLMNVVGWTFAYAYVWTVNADFDNPSSPGTAGCLAADTLCFVSVQESFGIAQAQPVFMDAFDVTERQKVTAVLRETSAALTQAVLASSVISNSTKEEAKEKIDSLTLRHRLWPPEPYPQGGSAFDTLYVNFSGTKRTVFDTWIESRRSLRAALPTPYYESLLTSRYRWHSGSALYLYALNELRVSLSALFPPTYVRHGSSTMTFAGLGFKLARQMVRSIDLHGRALDSAGRNTSWWQRQDKQGQPPCRLDVAASSRELRLLGDLFALDVAHEAMRKSSSWAPSNYWPPRLKLLEKLTTAQTFYVSYCSRLCDEPYGRLACNLAMNASRFGEAFGCYLGGPKWPTCVFV